jgi:predicted enzyme related to lactoylglutathione lyase
MHMTDHKIVHIEFAAKNPSQSAAFYKEVFGWEIQDVPEMNYIMFDLGDGLGGGFPSIDGDATKEGDVMVYISTDDIQASLEKIKAAGGKMLKEETEIPEMGWYAIFEDPAGNRVAVYKSMTTE